ncbi:MAG: viologen exporter family transport system permease protein [Acidimicrobiaceae bacterium]|nr:viologen exporter family transport system permease protein [Acidimicrobiaceae bacterium]
MVDAGTIAVYRRLIGARVRSDFGFRASFAFRLVSACVITGLDFAVIAVVFTKIGRLGGWRFSEVAYLYGACGVAFSLAETWIGGVDYLAVRIKQGTFDRVLVRPMSALGQLATEEFALRRIGKLFQAGAVLVAALVAIPVHWTAGRVLMVPVTIAAGAVIYGAVWVATAAIAFWTVDANELGSALTYGGNYLTQYPITIYSAWLRRLLAFVVPMAFVGYFPTLYVLGRTAPSERFGLPSVVMFSSPAVAAAACAVASAIWRVGLRRYRSTGS